MSLLYGLDFPKYLPLIHLATSSTCGWCRCWLGAWASHRCRLAGDAVLRLRYGGLRRLWKPMYVFDLFCATFCLASILLYTHRRYVLSFVAFWLAYKSKELAVMLPSRWPAMNSG